MFVLMCVHFCVFGMDRLGFSRQGVRVRVCVCVFVCVSKISWLVSSLLGVCAILFVSMCVDFCFFKLL